MFCNQCEQVAINGGCLSRGVCGKDHRTSSLQDALTYAVRGLSTVANAGRAYGVADAEADRFVAKALFSTLTNVNFDENYFDEWTRKAVDIRESLKEKVLAAGGPSSYGDLAAHFTPAAGIDALVAQGVEIGLPIDPDASADKKSLQEITLYGLRGIAAYADHAAILGVEDESVYVYMHKALAAISDKSLDVPEWIGLTLEAGKANLTAMEILDRANTTAYGIPAPTEVKLGHRKGKAILISGHDLKDLETLLKITENTGINIYTHGEMLPAHGYPGLKKYPHLAGHYGTAWQNQKKEFKAFPGAILMTTNCLMPPDDSYADRVFATGLVGHPKVASVVNGEFGAVVEKALSMKGFDSDSEKGEVMVGFAADAVLSAAPAIIEAVKSGAVKHFFLVGGCDGAKPGRNYYTDFVEGTPADTLVLTLACGKFRFFDKKLGNIGPFPRLLDVGQCNDAYSAIRIASALAEAFKCGVNDLPLSLVLSWYEQKAVAILLTLLSLGIKGIRLGPTLPAFVTPNVLGVLVENFDIKPIKTAQEDLTDILGPGSYVKDPGSGKKAKGSTEKNEKEAV